MPRCYPEWSEVYFDNYQSDTPADAAEKAYEAGKNYFAQSEHQECAVYNLEEEYSCRVRDLQKEAE